MHLFLAFFAQMPVQPIFWRKYHFAVPASRLVAYVFLRMLHETCQWGKRCIAELAMVIFGCSGYLRGCLLSFRGCSRGCLRGCLRWEPSSMSISWQQRSWRSPTWTVRVVFVRTRNMFRVCYYWSLLV